MFPTNEQSMNSHRAKAQLAHQERLQARARWGDKKTPFGARFTAAGTSVKKWFEEKKHENKADRLEKAEMERLYKAKKAQQATAAGGVSASAIPPTSTTGAPSGYTH
jgi:hypothetical protein